MRLFRSLAVFLLALSASAGGRAQGGVHSRQLSHPQIQAIAQDDQGFIWFGTARGLNRYNGTAYTVFYSSSLGGGLNNDNILSLCYDRQGTLWIGTECGLNWYRDGAFHHLYTTVFNPVDRIEEADEHSIYFNDKAGRFRIDKESLEVLEYVPTPAPARSANARRVALQFTDRDGGVWRAGDRDGWDYTAPNQPFRSIDLVPGLDRISHLTWDREGYLWMRIGTRLCSFSVETGQIVWQDGRNECGGLFLRRNGNLVVLQGRRTIAEYAVHDGIPRLVVEVHPANEIFSMTESSDGTLWLSSRDELRKVEPDSRVTPFKIERPFSYILPSPGDGRIFVPDLAGGLMEVLPDGSVRDFGEDFRNVSAILMARDGTFWIGTYGEGLIHYDENSGRIERFDAVSGVMVGDIKSLVQDREGNIWISTATSLSRYNPWTQTLSALQDFRYRSGRFYDLISSSLGPDGKVYFGGSGGLTVIDPTRFRPVDKDIPLFLESAIVNDRDVPAGSGLELNYRENSLSFRFAGLDFQSGPLLNYAWRLEGFESDWHSNALPEAVYSQLPPGHYIFRARVREQNKEWSRSEIALPVVIRPSPLASPAAKAAYLLLGLLLFGTGLWFFIRLSVQKERLALLQQRGELRQQHIDFMTNISHEFRTPLTLIVGPAKELEKSDLNEEDRKLVQLIGRNAGRLQALLKQILPGREGRVTDDTLKIRQNDLVSIVASMISQFSFAAQQKEQELRSDMPESCLAWFDTEIVSKVLGNLLSNAIKYTPEGGHICVSLAMQGDSAVIEVRDDGIGIPEHRRERIFERFERLGRDESEVEGSGIGLNFAREIAMKHGGTLTYAPAPSRGSVFTFAFPVTAEHYPQIPAGREDAVMEMFIPAAMDPEKRTLLIVEDTEEIRLFLCRLFADSYNVIAATDGLEAVDHLKLIPPDLVLSDVIMPGKTGYGLCRDIKQNPDWNHIPVILLTAKTDAGSSVEGMKAGADAYIPKPFDPDVLKATVESLIRNRLLLQEKVRDLTSDNLQREAEKVKLPEADRLFLEKMHAYLDSRLEEADFNVADAARAIGMSYSSLYAKVKAVTGVTPLSYMTRYRMNIARQLLQEGTLNVSEVAYRVGSSSPSTFSREFKNHFGYPPSQVRKQD